jgi:hypothetical protein
VILTVSKLGVDNEMLHHPGSNLTPPPIAVKLPTVILNWTLSIFSTSLIADRPLDHRQTGRRPTSEEIRKRRCPSGVSGCLNWPPRTLSRTLRPILNLAPRSKILTSGAKLPPRGEFCPPGLSPRGGILCSSLHSSKQQSVHTWGWIFPLGNRFHPWGPGLKLRMALSPMQDLFEKGRLGQSFTVDVGGQRRRGGLGGGRHFRR